MAFIFVPNADGGFDEGDRQTNGDTGVEYIYVDGAWRPLGPKIEDQFDALDERYVNVDGDVMHGSLVFNQGIENPANLLIRPNVQNTSTSIYQLNSGALRLRSLPAENTNEGSTTHLAIGKNEETGEPETYIYHLQDPAGPLHGVNQQFLENYVAEQLEDVDVDLSSYLPLTGGTLTGGLNINNRQFTINNSTGTDTFYIQGSGFAQSRDMIRFIRTDNGPIIQGRDADNVTQVEFRNNGNYTLRGTGNIYGNLTNHDRGRFIVRDSASVAYFMALDESKARLAAYSGKTLELQNIAEPQNATDGATKSYVDSQIGIGIAPPAPLRWIWRNYDSTIDPGEGKFAWNSSSGFFRINYITADGVNLGKSRPSSKDITFDTNLIGSIWYKDGDGWKLKQMFDVYRMQWDRNDCIWLYRRSTIVGGDGFTADVQYHITIGGLF